MIVLPFIALLAVLHGMPLFAGLGAFALILHSSAATDTPWQDLIVAVLDPYENLTGSDIFLPIPFFTMAGFLLANSGMPKRVIYAFSRLFTRLPGGAAFVLGCVALVTLALFTPLTGASGVSIIALGGLLLPILISVGYKEDEAVGAITAGGSLGLLFFPSLPVILYGIISVNKAPIGELFLAGLFPGLIFLLLPMGYLYFVNRGKKDIPQIPRDDSMQLWKLIPEISLIPIAFILFFTGIITVAETGAIFLTGVILLEIIAFREINLKKLPEILEEAFSLLGGILIIIFFAVALTKAFIYNEIPQKFFVYLNEYISSKYAFLALLNIFLLIAGALMDIFSAIVVLAPLIIPVAESYGINMVHLGILFLTNLEIGYLTPPVGINLFISSFRFNKPLPVIYRTIFPYLLVMIIAQLAVTYIPALSLWYK
ncbi:MAG: TRAP transporter large permease subunit [Leptospiraceae bacterium]|nr:TRAP transporter large permease subunit [Leptospiraceae bacterium]MCB1200187.1 TRAP transporter large permease subunit [Leptospiraceae bacterium]